MEGAKMYVYVGAEFLYKFHFGQTGLTLIPSEQMLFGKASWNNTEFIFSVFNIYIYWKAVFREIRMYESIFLLYISGKLSFDFSVILSTIYWYKLN